MNRKRRSFTAALALFLAAGLFPAVAPAAPKSELWPRWEAHDPAAKQSIDHGAWDRFLGSFVVAGADGINRVAYARAAGNAAGELQGYLDAMAAQPISRFGRAEQKAYWINLYNALTVKVVIDHLPVASIRDIDLGGGGFFSSGPWDKKLIDVEGEPVSLNDIEHRILRPIWRDPRLHYALNCASLGCPNLAVRAYVPERLEEMLIRAAKAYINHSRGVRIVDGEITLSKIYDWYADDFGDEAGLLDHIRQYASSDLETRLMLAKGIDGYVYDWGLNGVE
jgi:hypothetical protein